jgi:hypothetical protein
MSIHQSIKYQDAREVCAIGEERPNKILFPKWFPLGIDNGLDILQFKNG